MMHEGWIKLSRIKFPCHGAMLTVRERDEDDGITGNLADPTMLERAIRDMIRRHRPELEGCEIDSMTFSPWNRRWEIGVTHPSLPLWEDGAYRESMPLIPFPTAVTRDEMMDLARRMDAGEDIKGTFTVETDAAIKIGGAE